MLLKVFQPAEIVKAAMRKVLGKANRDIDVARIGLPACKWIQTGRHSPRRRHGVPVHAPSMRVSPDRGSWLYLAYALSPSQGPAALGWTGREACPTSGAASCRSEEHTSELQSL